MSLELNFSCENFHFNLSSFSILHNEIEKRKKQFFLFFCFDLFRADLCLTPSNNQGKICCNDGDKHETIHFKLAINLVLV